MRKSRMTQSELPGSFEALCAMHWPRPIHDDVDYDNASEMVGQLAVMKRRSIGQEEYLETLTMLIEKYDRENIAAPEAQDPIEVLKYLMDGLKMSASDLGRILGNRTLGPAIIRGDRKISKANAIRLGKHFKLSPAIFLQA
jgi:antitoxin component HigA of HigAB toxin-antitoxin module